MEDNHHHSSTHPSQTTTRRILGSSFSGINVDIFADLRITAPLHHKVDMAINNLTLLSSLPAMLR
jgi:hypothetical protein